MPDTALAALPDERFLFLKDSASMDPGAESRSATVLTFPDRPYSSYDSSTIATPLNERIDMLEELYDFRDVNHVIGYLNENPFLIALLEETFRKIQEYFPDAPMELHVLHADGEEPSFLVASVRPGITAREAFTTMKQFRHEWWFGEMDRARDKLLITADF